MSDGRRRAPGPPGPGAAPSRTGRRPGTADTRGRIVDAARASFGEHGFDGATIRDIAGRAGVDPALVHHYFGSKQQLFVTTMELPFEMPGLMSRVLDGPRDEMGARFATAFLELWEQPATQPLLLGVVRSATTDPVAASMLRQVLTDGPLLALAGAADRSDAALRVTLAGSQLIGLVLARYVMRVEPIASAPREVLVRAIAPTIQRYLTGDLADGERSPGPSAAVAGSG